MWNPVARFKRILGELQANGRQGLELSRELLRQQDQRLAALEASSRAVEAELGALSRLVHEHGRQLAMQAAELGQRDPGEALLAAFRRVGVLNWENDSVSGERHFLRSLLTRRPDALVLDVGANEGQFSGLARELSDRAVIHAFEPHPRSFAALEARAAGLRIEAHRLALGDEVGEVTMYDYADEQGSQHASVYRGVIEEVHRRPSAAVTAPCSTLDAAAAELGFAKIDLLKIDTEGHELAVLQGAKRLLERGAIDVIQFEFNEMNVISRVYMRDFMQLLADFRFFRLLPTGAMPMDAYDPRVMEIFAFQNIACVRRDLDSQWVVGVPFAAAGAS